MPNALTPALLDAIATARDIGADRNAYRELFQLTLGLVAERDHRIAIQDRTIASQREQIRTLVLAERAMAAAKLREVA